MNNQIHLLIWQLPAVDQKSAGCADLATLYANELQAHEEHHSRDNSALVNAWNRDPANSTINVTSCDLTAEAADAQNDSKIKAAVEQREGGLVKELAAASDSFHDSGQGQIDNINCAPCPE